MTRSKLVCGKQRERERIVQFSCRLFGGFVLFSLTQERLTLSHKRVSGILLVARMNQTCACVLHETRAYNRIQCVLVVGCVHSHNIHSSNISQSAFRMVVESCYCEPLLSLLEIPVGFGGTKRRNNHISHGDFFGPLSSLTAIHTIHQGAWRNRNRLRKKQRRQTRNILPNRTAPLWRGGWRPTRLPRILRARRMAGLRISYPDRSFSS